jgi:AP-1 complex subunit beta-1
VHVCNTHLLSSGPCLYWLRAQAAKDVVLAEKPTISDDSNSLDPTLLDDLLANIATLSSVYHKPPEAFVSRVRPTAQRDEDEEYAEQDSGAADQSAPISGVSDNASTGYGAVPAPVPPPPGHGPQRNSGPPPAAAAPPPQPAPVPDLLDLMGLDNALVPSGPVAPSAG